MSTSQAYSLRAATNSNSLYAGGLADSSMPSAYGGTPRTNSSYYGAGIEPLSRQSSRGDGYEAYPGLSERRPSIYAPPPGTAPIPIPAPRRPSTFSDASGNSFDSMYGFRDCTFEWLS